MPIRGSMLRPSNSATSYLYVDETGNNTLKGRLYNHALERMSYFDGVYTLLKELEVIYDCLGFPQATHTTRTFRLGKSEKSSNVYPKKYDLVEKHLAEVTKKVDNQEFKIESGGKGTFVIRVQYRQNATWQGSIQWLEGKKTQNFRSDLEMLKLIDDAIRSEDDDDDMAKWE